MADKGVLFDERSARLIADVVRRFRPPAPKADGELDEPYRNTPRGFWAKITDNVSIHYTGGGYAGAPYAYAWTEQYDQLSGGATIFADFPSGDGGRSGTTTANFALNVDETNQNAAPIPDGSIV